MCIGNDSKMISAMPIETEQSFIQIFQENSAL